MRKRVHRKTTDRTSDRYDAWRLAVKRRDKFSCQFPGCKNKGPVEVHHIVPWSLSIELRHIISNGICLCKKCHDKVTGNELTYMELFRTIIRHKEEKRERKNDYNSRH